jgi:hypothetical protein
VPKTPLLRCHFMLKTIILPRQARGKHRESTQKEVHFSHRRPVVDNPLAVLDWSSVDEAADLYRIPGT